MICPRCQKPLVSCIGADASGTRYQCRICTNEWYEKVETEPVEEEPPTAEVILPTTTATEIFNALEDISKYVKGSAEYHKTRSRECAQDVMTANKSHQHHGAQLALYQIANYIDAKIKNLKGRTS